MPLKSWHTNTQLIILLDYSSTVYGILGYGPQLQILYSAGCLTLNFGANFISQFTIALFYYTTKLLSGYHLHEYLLACWGVPIGEMIDLKKLAEACRSENKWWCFVTSAPANVHRKYLNNILAIIWNHSLIARRWCELPCQFDSYSVNSIHSAGHYMWRIIERFGEVDVGNAEHVVWGCC